MKIVTIAGARPQFVKAAMVSRAIQKHNREGTQPLIEEYLLHTGQHYDANMSEVFFREMGIPQPARQLECGNGTHGEMTGRMLAGIEKVLMEVCPDYVLVYGDTNSTLAGALAAVKLHIPVVHVEAGLRSFNRQMPEEINRVLTDHASTVLCCPTSAAVRHLKEEGIHRGVYHTGDVMYDAALFFGDMANTTSSILSRLRLTGKSFHLCTVHRAENTDRKERIGSIMEALKQIGESGCPVVFPLHPRTRSCLDRYGYLPSAETHPGIILSPPLPFLDMVMLERHAATILTDSGGIQKEAYFHRTPCITLREETEWTETVDAGWNRIAGYKTEDIIYCMNHLPEKREEIPEYGNGDAAGIIIGLL